MKFICKLIFFENKDSREYYIINAENDQLWISNKNGEGGTFCSDKFYQCIDKFFKDNY